MGHKKRKIGKYGVVVRKRSGPAPLQPIPKHTRKGSFSTGTKMLLGLFAILIIGGIGYWQLSSSSQPISSPTAASSPMPGSSQSYPQSVTGVVYSYPTMSSGGSSASLPASVVKNNKLTFVDLKLQNPLNELAYQGRTIPLSLYRGGQYLPLLVISTPSGNVVSGLRVCEPCGSFSFHIVSARYLDCDTCHTKWDIETLTGVSGGCPSYPPPKLPTSAANDITIDLSTLGVQVTY